MNNIDSESLFWIAIVAGVFLTPVVTFYNILTREKQLFNQIAGELLKLSGKEIEDQAPLLIRRKQHFHRRSLLLGFTVSFVSLGVGIISLPENSRELVYLLFLGPVAIGLLGIRYDSNMKGSVARGLSKKIIKEGRFDQVDGWLRAFPKCNWIKVGLLWEELLLSWGSWNAFALMTNEHLANVVHKKTQGVLASQSEWTRYFKELRQDLIDAKTMGVYHLEALGGKYDFWSSLLKNFEHQETLDMLSEMDESDLGLKKELLESLSLQRDYIRAVPHLFCPRCNSRGIFLQLQYVKIVHCECDKAESLITGIEEVVGMIGNVHSRGVNGSTFYLPVWDGELRKASTGEIDRIVVAKDFSGNLDWALASLFEAQESRYPELGLKYVLNIPHEAVLQANTVRMLDEHPGLEIEKY